MLGKVPNSSIKPQALGVSVNSSTYGQTIPVIYGMTKGSVYLIWMAHLRQVTGSGKKGKGMSGKKGSAQPMYVANIDCLIGSNPIAAVLQAWDNNAAKLGMNFKVYRSGQRGGSITIPDSHFYALIAVTSTENYDVTFNDYGSTGSRELTGSFERPWWNLHYQRPNATDDYDNLPCFFYWSPGSGPTIDFEHLGSPGDLNFYYAATLPGGNTVAGSNNESGANPLAALRLSFESVLGTGPEYGSTYQSQQILYPHYAGVGSSNFDLGITGMAPAVRLEILGSYPSLATGDADFTDMIVDIFGSAVSQAGFSVYSPNYTKIQHSLAAYDFPGVVYQKYYEWDSVFGAPDPCGVRYDQGNTAGNILIVAVAQTRNVSISDDAQNDWNPVFSGSDGSYQIWYAIARSTVAVNTVRVSGTTGSLEIGILEIAGINNGSDAATGAGIHRPSTYLNGWGNNAHVGPYEEGVDGATNWGLNNDTTHPYDNPDLAVDGSQATAASCTITHSHGYAGCIWKFDALDSTPSSLTLNILSEVPSIPEGNTRSSGIWYSLDEGANWTMLYNAATRGQQWDVIPLSATQDASQIQIMAFLDAHDDESHSVYDIYLSTTSTSGTSATETVTTATGTNSATITTQNVTATPSYTLGFAHYPNQDSPQTSSSVLWPLTYKFGKSFSLVYRRTWHPSTFAYTAPGNCAHLALLSCAGAQPPDYPRPLGNILDPYWLMQTRNQCRANGLWGSLIMDSQKKASDWLSDLFQAANAAPVWSGFRLKSIPYSEVSAVGNGATYIAPTSGGPVEDLMESDMIGTDGQPLIEVVRTARIDRPNLLQIQTPNRTSDYNNVVSSQPETGSIALYGTRKDSPQVLNCVQDVSIARMILGVKVRRQNFNANTYKFKLNAKWKLLEPMDLVTISDAANSTTGITKRPVRILQIDEDDTYALDVQAEDFQYGVNAPLPVTTTNPAPYTSATSDQPASINSPIFMEPVARLTAGSQDELWIIVSDPDPSYGGCQIYMSTDGGTSYGSPVGTISGTAVTGKTLNEWPANLDPDTVHPLQVDLTESLAALSSFTSDQEDNAVSLCYVSGGSGSIDYELMSYGVATLTGTNQYQLEASGSNRLRRSVFSAPVAGTGVDHPTNSRFAFIGNAASGIFRLQIDPTWIGKTLYFKFCAFNQYGGGLQSLSDVAAYGHTLVGTNSTSSGSGAMNTYSVSPQQPLTQPTATTIHMATSTATFSTNSVVYAARSFTIPTPAAPTMYYVTLADPGRVGDVGATATLAAYCETGTEKVGVPGFTYMGAITAQPAGGGSGEQPGGWPTSQLFLINGQ
jgi:Putative phage tail protein